MAPHRRLNPKPAFDRTLLQQVLTNSTHVTSLWSYLLAHPDAQPHDVPGLPKTATETLHKTFTSLTSKVTSEVTSADQTTTKILLELQDGLSVEAVIMRHNSSAGKYAGGQRLGGPRATLCISSQAGCQMGCTFCATGTMGLKGDLLAGEIVEQLVYALRITPIRNIVFMGMGEPLNNYNAVCEAVAIMTQRPFGLSANHITVSTVGVVPRMLSLAQDLPGVNLALSLHAPTQELRATIVPAARAFPLERLMSALDSYLTASGRSVLVEYVMLAGVNDSMETAHQLGALLENRRVSLNLIPYNPTEVKAKFESSDPEIIRQFQKVVRERYNVRTTVRQEMGSDIAGACGQLALSTLGSTGKRQGGEDTQDIEDLSVRSLSL